MKLVLIILAVASIAGCAASAHTGVKSGRKGLHINCSGLTSSWDRCYSMASSSCINGYKVVARSDQAEEDSTSYIFGFNPAGYTSRNLIVICK
ncbi:hypothetical protein [Pseudomonas taiwanensis]|uniref:hypothetical protein n=1 Tax=Pseudomonas taiwanensis TaxID=470150 RepID=UPI0016445D79|nr:hypothetical protein [Pseudomonas taiwanensis]MBC3492381.1 hypothetical protein [Pseudomonas taiwanensis]